MSIGVKSGGGENVTPEVRVQSPLVAEILESLVGKVTIANATPETILEGYSAYVGQQLVHGELKDISKKIDFGEVTPSGTVKTLTIEHSLEALPSHALIFDIASSATVHTSNSTVVLLRTLSQNAFAVLYDSSYYTGGTGTSAGTTEWNKTTITFNAGKYFYSDKSYIWVALA